MLSNDSNARRVRRWPALVAILAVVNLLVIPALAQVGDEPLVEVVATDASAAEAGLDTGLFTFTRTGDTAAGLDVDYTVTGTATAGSDYVALSGVVSFAAGESTATVLVTPIDDSLVEGDETVVVTLDVSTDYAIGAADDAMVTIADNDEADDGDGDNGLLDPESMVFADCKRGGWAEFGVFKNQGDCVSFIATDGRNPPALLGSSENEDE